LTFVVIAIVFVIIVIAANSKGHSRRKAEASRQQPVTIINGKHTVTLTDYSDAQLRQAINTAIKESKSETKLPVLSGGGFRPSEIVWQDKYSQPVPCRIEYADRYGELKEARVALVSESGRHANGHEYVGAFSGGKFKTYRKDRVIRLERIN